MRAWKFLGCLAVLAALSGCSGKGGDKPATVKAGGTVTLNGAAVEGANVTFAPVAGGRSASGRTDGQGHFSLNTTNTIEGVTPGEYKVGISKEKTEGGLTEEQSQEYFAKHQQAPPPPKVTNELPEKYKNPAGAGMGTICLDYDDDGRTDIFVCNDKHWNFLFHNEGQGRFAETALPAGVACNYSGEVTSNMAPDAGDYNRDGRLDLFVTDYELEKPILFRNLGRGLFDDVTLRSGTALGTTAYVKWGCGLVDFDNDGHPDIFIGCGHLQDDIEDYNDRAACVLVRGQREEASYSRGAARTLGIDQ